MDNSILNQNVDSKAKIKSEEKMDKRRNVVLFLLFLAGVVNYLDRSALSISAPFIQKDLSLSAAQMGIVFSCFSVGYALFNIVGGIASDKFGARNTLLVAMIVWSAFSGSVALAMGLASLIVIRILFGMGEGPLSTTTNKMINSWFPPNKRAGTMGIASSGTPLGGAIAGPIVGFICLKYSWRMSFIFIMCVGFVWAFAWWKFVKERPHDHIDLENVRNNKVVSKEINSNEETPAYKIKTSFYLKQKTIIFNAIAFFSYNYILFFFLTWYPSYLVKERGLSVATMSVVNMIPWTLGLIALGSGGVFSDRLVKKFKDKHILFSRKIIIVCCLFIAAVSITLSGSIQNLAASVAMLAIAVFFMYLTGAIYWGVVNDVVDQHNVGSVGGFMHAIGNCAGILGPIVTGYIVQFTGSFSTAFIFAGAIALMGSLGALKFIKPIPKNLYEDAPKVAINNK
ncbi:MFS transporter [Clostridium beijerinckii]|nr:MFS transporter [Clostridium beijerinckii]